MVDKRHEITLKQLTIFGISAQIGLGILTLPSNLAKKTGHDGWLVVAAAGCIMLLLAIFIALLINRHPNSSILDINILLYGKYFGMFFNLAFICYILFTTSLSSRLFAEMIKISVLNQTPLIVISLFIFIPTVYQVSKGLKVICRFASLLILAHITLILTFLLIVRDARVTYLMPVAKSGIITIFKNIPYAFFSFLGIELITIFYPNVTNKNNVVKYVTIESIYIAIFYIIVVAFTTALFGENKLKMIIFAMYSVERAIKVPILERLDVFFIAFWFPIMAGSVRSYFFSSYYCIAKLFKIRKEKLLIAIVFVVVIIIGRIPKNLEDIFTYMNYAALLGAANILFIAFSLFISLIRRR